MQEGMGDVHGLSRRAILRASAGVAAMSVLGACSSGGSGKSTGKVTLALTDDWAASDPKGPTLNRILKAFQDANPNISITQNVFVDSDVPTKVDTAFLAHKEPDVVFNNLWGPTQEWLDKGVVVPINDLLTQWGLKDSFEPAALATFTQADGKIMAFPLEGFNWPLWFNTGILKKAGVDVPTTMDQLLAAVPAIKAAGYMPFAAPGAEGMGRALLRFILHAGMTDDEVKQVFTNGGFSGNANARKGVELFVQLRDAGAFPNAAGLNNAAAGQLYYDGKAAIWHDGSWDYTVPKGQVAADTVLGGMPLPAGSPHSQPIYYQAYNAKGVWITRSGAKKLDAVGKLVQFLYRPENIASFVEQTAMVPPLRSTPFDPNKLNPLFTASLTTLPKANSIAPFWSYIPAAADSEALNVTKLAYVPGTKADEILEKMDAAYKG